MGGVCWNPSIHGADIPALHFAGVDGPGRVLYIGIMISRTGTAAVKPPASSAFRHTDHVEAAWRLARSPGGLDGLGRLVDFLRDMAERHGMPGRYHETLTWGWYFLIRERMARGGPDASWESFAAANPDLLDGTAIGRLYRPETLRSDRARGVFVLPDRGIA